MIHIEKGKLTIVIEDHFIEDTYTEMVVQLIDLLQLQNPDLVPRDNYYAVYNLLKELMPSYNQICAINGIKVENNLANSK